MTHRRSRVSTAALLTVILSLVLCAGASAQDGDEPVNSDDPTVRAQGEGGAEDESGAEAAGGRDVDCSDFDTQEEAQRFFESQGGPDEDPHRLDEDPGEDDGQACENLPSEGDVGARDDDETPAGSVESGYGPVNPEPEAGSSLPLAIGAGLGLITLLGLGILRLRRAE